MSGLSSPEPEDGGAVSRDASFLPDGVTPGATNLPDPGPSTPGSVQAGRDEMVAEVARALGAAGVSPFEIEDWRIADFADRLRRAGFRQVVDDDIAARLDQALELLDRYSQLSMGGTPDLFSPDCGHMATGTVSHDPWDCVEDQVASVRAAVRALREGQ